MRTRIIGVCSCMKTFDFFYGIRLGELVLKHSDNLSKTLQSPRLSAAEAPRIVAITLKTLESLREDDKFGQEPYKLVKTLVYMNQIYQEKGGHHED